MNNTTIKMKHIILIVSLICAVALNGFAQQAPPDSQKYNFTVADCINYAYEHQHDVKNANLDVESAGYHAEGNSRAGVSAN
ncbi:MAG TPA: hypothetical protein DCO83_11700 [Mucilaginibacter sp.]|nr:hypothetical protein [Mucilaginibacter sp.]